MLAATGPHAEVANGGVVRPVKPDEEALLASHPKKMNIPYEEFGSHRRL